LGGKDILEMAKTANIVVFTGNSSLDVLFKGYGRDSK
jgi:hypothetical protein